jgi:DNA (cytosine-5)-methyltransferase 1
MNYLSVCSGIEAATTAWHDMGWNPVGFSEIEKFPSQVLANHYPNVTNFGDMTKFKEWNINEPVNILVGGTPCQSFSVAGLRKGLQDPRGNLALVYLGIADHFKPKWIVWENVPGVLSSNGGRDFGSFLGALAELGYGFSYRVLDAQHFGVPQRRKRVFVVGCLGDWRSAASVLFERESMSGNNSQSRKSRKIATAPIGGGVAYGGADPECSDTVTSKWAKGSGGPSGNECGLFVATMSFNVNARPDEMRFENNLSGTLTCNQRSGVTVYETHPADSRVKEMGDTCQTVTRRWGTGGGNVPIAHTFKIRGGCEGGGKGYLGQDEKAFTLSTTQDQQLFNEMRVRRLTPLECERLQGFPDNYTNIFDKTPDGNRYKALGNSMAVPVMRWIGQRINEVENAS